MFAPSFAFIRDEGKSMAFEEMPVQQQLPMSIESSGVREIYKTLFSNNQTSSKQDSTHLAQAFYLVQAHIYRILNDRYREPKAGLVMKVRLLVQLPGPTKTCHPRAWKVCSESLCEILVSGLFVHESLIIL